MRNLVIRASKKVDAPDILGIYAHEVLHGLATFEQTPPSLEEMRSRMQGVLRLGLPYLVAELDGAIVGYAYANNHRPRPAYRNSIENSIYVAGDLQGKGIGKALLQTLIDRCESGRWRQMVAVIGDSDNAGSLGLHKSLGFRHVGLLEAVGFKLGRWVDTVIMQRPLGDGSKTPPDDD